MPLSVFTHTMPLALADAISGLEAVPLPADRALVVLIGEAAADSCADDPIELDGAELAGAAVGVEGECGDSGTSPDSIAAFLRLRVCLLVTAVSLLAWVPTGSVTAVSDVLLFFLFFFDAVSLGGVVLSEAEVAVSAAAVFFLFFDFFVLAAVASAVVVLSVAAAAWSFTLASFLFFFFFFFFLLVEFEVWSSVELVACGLAMAEIPDSAKNTQSTVIHALILVCSLLIISSLARNGPARTVIFAPSRAN